MKTLLSFKRLNTIANPRETVRVYMAHAKRYTSFTMADPKEV